MLDCGVRSGADAFKALALGATAVGIGRPYGYGLAIAGEAGVREVLQNFKADFDLTMGLAGCRRSRRSRLKPWCPRAEPEQEAKVGLESAGLSCSCRHVTRMTFHPAASRRRSRARSSSKASAVSCTERPSSSTMRRWSGQAQSTSRALDADVRDGPWKTGSEEELLEALLQLASDDAEAALNLFNDGFEERHARFPRITLDEPSHPDGVPQAELLGLPKRAAQLVALNDGTEVERECAEPSWSESCDGR